MCAVIESGNIKVHYKSSNLQVFHVTMLVRKRLEIFIYIFIIIIKILITDRFI